MKIPKIITTLMLIQYLTACIPTASEPVWTQHLDSAARINARLLPETDGSFRRLYVNDNKLISEAYLYSGEASGETIEIPFDQAPSQFNQNTGISYRLDRYNDQLVLTKYDLALALEWQIDGATTAQLLGDFSGVSTVLSFSDDDSIITLVAGQRVVLLNSEGQVIASKQLMDEVRKQVTFIGATDNGVVALKECENIIGPCVYSTLDFDLSLLSSFEYRASHLVFSGDGFYSASNKGVCRLSNEGDQEWCYDFEIYTNAKTLLYDNGDVYYLQISKFDEEKRKVVLEKISAQGESLWYHQFLNAEEVSDLRLTDQGLSFSHETKIFEMPLIHLDFLLGGTELHSYLQVNLIQPNGKIKQKIVMDSMKYRHYVESIMPYVATSYYSDAGTSQIHDYLVSNDRVVAISTQTAEQVYSQGSVQTVSASAIELSLFE